ncbi:MAG: zinc-binding alcohol dehydrogenase, partial [Bacteroidia bacterium]
MEILEVPFPALNKGDVLVRNYYSVISAGTEGKTVTDARKGYIAKARSKQKEVKQVIEMIKRNGFLSTYQLVMNKLDTPSALGYSCAGEVIAVGAEVKGFKVGDKVACGGASASHADVVAVPVNLCVKVPESVDLKHAAFATIAAITIQGIRQAELKMGENCLIIGMGLLGQLTAKILKASGVKTICVDVADKQVSQSKEAGIENVYNRNTAGIEDLISQFSKGNGVDAVIITAGTSSIDPIEFAGSSARKKGKVVIVGAVPTGFDRANYFKKELDLRMSMSYGPGRYDPNYEEKGMDYPIGYVRWTENRNMQSFIDLLASNAISIEKLISHTYTLEEAPSAYDMILSKIQAY